jgi:HAMP domain-containing protein
MIPLFQTVVDTLLVRQVPPDRTGFEQVVFVAAGLAQVVTLVVVVLLAVIFFRMWKAQQAMQEQLRRLSEQVDPMIASATAAAENVRDLTEAVKDNAVAAADALSNATERVRDSVSGIADRIDDFGALLGRVTDKAEAVADVAEAAVSTFKAGRRLWRAGSPGEKPRDGGARSEGPAGRVAARDAARDETSDAAGRDAPRRLTDEEGDAHDSPYADDGIAPRPRPRRRRHRRRHGGGGAPPGGDGAPPSA